MKKLFGRKHSHEADLVAELDGDGFDSPAPRARGESSASAKKRFSWRRRGGRKGSQQAPVGDLIGDVAEQSTALFEALVMSGLVQPRDGTKASGAVLSARRKPVKVYYEGKLEKQGNFFKTWHARHFVLTARALSYYTSAKAYEQRAQALGRLPFGNMYHEAGSVVNEVPAALARRMQIKNKANLFCISCVGRTYFFSAPSEEARAEWTDKINAIFERFMRKKKNASARGKRRAKSRRLEDKLKVFEDCNDQDELDEAYEDLVAKMINDRTARRVILAWKCYVDYRMKHGEPEEQGLPAPLRAQRSRVSQVLRPGSSKIFRVPEF